MTGHVGAQSHDSAWLLRADLQYRAVNHRAVQAKIGPLIHPTRWHRTTLYAAHYSVDLAHFSHLHWSPTSSSASFRMTLWVHVP